MKAGSQNYTIPHKSSSHQFQYPFFQSLYKGVEYFSYFITEINNLALLSFAFFTLVLIMSPSEITTANATIESIEMPKKRAYVTFLAGNGDYVKGVVGLAKGLRKAKSVYPLVVAILPDVPEDHRQILKSQGCIVREIEPVCPPENQTDFAMAYYVINYSKLRIWEVNKSINFKPTSWGL